MNKYVQLFRWLTAFAGILFAMGTYFRSKQEWFAGMRGITIQEVAAGMFVLAFFLSYLDARKSTSKYERWSAFVFLVMITVCFAIAFGYS